MNNTKSPKNVSLKISLNCGCSVALIGAVASALVWILKNNGSRTDFYEMASRKNLFLIIRFYLCSRCGNYRYFPKNFRDYPEDLKPLWKSRNRKKIRI